MGEVLYKATRLDGTDFRTGTLDYAAACGTGQPVTYPGTAAAMVQDDPSTYLSVSAELGEVLTGGWWPCRLFRVEAVGPVIGHSDMAFKRCCRSLLVAQELPAHLALGPNGEQVAALITRAGALTADDARKLAAARDAAWAAAWDAAKDAARAAAWEAARDAARAAARDAARKEQAEILEEMCLKAIEDQINVAAE